MRIIGSDLTVFDKSVKTISVWYLSEGKYWIVECCNSDDFQVGDALYSGHRSDAIHDAISCLKAHPGAVLNAPTSIRSDIMKAFRKA